MSLKHHALEATLRILDGPNAIITPKAGAHNCCEVWGVGVVVT
jgi:hypothetical protein